MTQIKNNKTIKTLIIIHEKYIFCDFLSLFIHCILDFNLGNVLHSLFRWIQIRDLTIHCFVRFLVYFCYKKKVIQSFISLFHTIKSKCFYPFGTFSKIMTSYFSWKFIPYDKPRPRIIQKKKKLNLFRIQKYLRLLKVKNHKNEYHTKS